MKKTKYPEKTILDLLPIEERWNSLVKNTLDFVYIVDRQGKFIFVNRTDLGFKEKKILGTEAIDYVLKEYRPIVKKAFNRCLKTAHPQTYETEVVAVKGETRWFRSNVSPVKVGKKTMALLIISKDVTETKKAEIELQKMYNELEQRVYSRTVELQKLAEKMEQNLVGVEREKNRWEAIFENVEEGVYTIDQNRKITSFNGASEIATGITEKEAIGRTPQEIFDCQDNFGHRYPDFDPLAKVFQSLEPVPYEEHIHTSLDGSERWVGVSYTPILEEGKLVQCVAINRDITALKEIEMAKSEFVSIASHELRTPLTVINGYLSLLLSGDLGDIGDASKRMQHIQVINKIYNETRRLTSLVEELLNVTRIEEGRIKLNLREVYLSEIIREVVSEFEPLAQRQNSTLKANFVGEEKPIVGDCDKIKQVLVNLVDNAIKYNPPQVQIYIKTRPFNDHIEVVVEDNGVGIPLALQARIFSKFQQLPGSYTKENKGSGLGLFIAKSLVELHHGSMEVKSTPGKGSEFIFSLPTVAS